jgi:diacylglycerol O-acyltransferase / wax synthase
MIERLSPMEAIMWRVGQDATLRMTVGALIILDGPPTTKALDQRLDLVASHAPRLRRRPDDPTALRTRPAWVDDADPVPGSHLRSLSIAAPGSLRQALDLVGLLESIPFDPERSPWDVTLIEGLERGRAALYLRAHHALTDGLGGVRLLGLLLDEHEWPDDDRTTTEDRWPVEAGPSTDGNRQLGTLTITIDLPRAVRRFLQGVNAAREVAREVDPLDSAVRGVQRALDVANSVSRQMMVTGGPLSSRPASRSLLSRFEVISVDDARAASLALGGSRNDLLVAAAATGLGRYHERLGQPTAELRLATPTSRRGEHEAGGNWFAPARLEVPTSVARPGPQFGVVVERLAQARREPALQVASTLAATLGRLPTRLLLPALHAQAESVDFAATALPGLRGPRHVCGSLIEASYPLGPRLGCPMNITAFGNDGRLDVGIALDSVAIAEPDLLIECLTEAFARYAEAASQPSADTG